MGELMGGSQREERLDVLERRLAELGLPKEPYWWYLELRKYGSGTSLPQGRRKIGSSKCLRRRKVTLSVEGVWGRVCSAARGLRVGV